MQIDEIHENLGIKKQFTTTSKKVLRENSKSDELNIKLERSTTEMSPFISPTASQGNQIIKLEEEPEPN